MTGFIVLMAAFMASVAVSIDGMLPALAVIGEEFALKDVNQTQYIIVGIFAGMAVGQLVCGPLSDALGRKKVLYGGLALYALGSLVCALSHSLEAMLAGRLLQGLGLAGPQVSAVAIIRDKFSGDEMARILSLVMTVFILVPCFAPLLGQGILLFASWRWIFGLFFAVAVTLIFCTAFILEETLPREKRIPFDVQDIMHGFREVFANRTTLWHTVAMGLIFGAFMGYLNSVRQIFQDMFHTGNAFSLYFGALALVFGLASLLNARLVEKMHTWRLCRRAGRAAVICSALFLLWRFFFGDSLFPFLAYIGAIYLCMGFLFGNLNAIAMEPMGHIAGIAAAVIGAVAALLDISISVLVGQMFDGTLLPLTLSFLILSTLTLGAMKMARRKKPLPA